MLDVGLPWRGLDLTILFGAVATWKVLDLAARVALKRHSSEKVRQIGFSYATSVLNATLAVALGGTGLVLLWNAPPEARTFISADPIDPWFSATNICARGGYIFSSWVRFYVCVTNIHSPSSFLNCDKCVCALLILHSLRPVILLSTP